MSKNPTSKNKKRLDPSVKKWLCEQDLVVVGYFDSKGVNLNYLLELWIECKQDGDYFGDVYPYASDHFQIKVVSKSDERHRLSHIMPEFEGCVHLKAWCLGEEYSFDELKQVASVL